MAAFKSFEDIQAWQKARELTSLVYSFSSHGSFARDFALVDQIRRAAISVMSNIAEGFERGRPTEFAQFLRIAKGSAGEVRAQLYIALDQGYIDKVGFERALGLTDETSRMIATLTAYLSNPETRNSQRATRNSTKPQRGFALPAAIFLLVVLGGLAAWLMRMTEQSMAQDALELEGERAYQAAQAGLEAGIYAARQPGANCGLIAQNIAFGNTLTRFTASVTCTAYSADEGGTSLVLYEITSKACNQPVAGACPNPAPTLAEYAERHVRAVVEGGA